MFEARIAESNRFNEQNPVSYDKRTYTVDEIQDILGISCLLYTSQQIAQEFI